MNQVSWRRPRNLCLSGFIRAQSLCMLVLWGTCRARYSGTERGSLEGLPPTAAPAPHQQASWMLTVVSGQMNDTGEGSKVFLTWSQEGPICTKCKDGEEGRRSSLFPWVERQVRGVENRKWRVGSAAVVTETSSPLPWGSFILGATFTWENLG